MFRRDHATEISAAAADGTLPEHFSLTVAPGLSRHPLLVTMPGMANIATTVENKTSSTVKLSALVDAELVRHR
jgi:hypothetical protein